MRYFLQYHTYFYPHFRIIIHSINTYKASIDKFMAQKTDIIFGIWLFLPKYKYIFSL